MTFEETLTAWMPTQRWFAGKGARILDLAIVADTELEGGDPGLRKRIPERLEHAVIGSAGSDMGAGGLTAYDALHDPELTRFLLAAIAAGEQDGPVRFAREPDVAIDTDLDSLVLTGEQSNTSLMFGEISILKVFRRLSPGPNPDLEVPRALARLGSQHVAEPLGWIETRMDGAPTILGILSRYLRAASDGWSLAAASVRDLYDEVETAGIESAADAGGDFAGEAHRLGEATAGVHRNLAEAFGTDELPAGATADLARQMFHRLDVALATVPQLGRHADMLGAAFSDLAKLERPLLVQRVHGD